MPILGNLLFNIFVGIAAWLAKFLGQKIAVTLAIVVLLTGLFAALYMAGRGLVSAAIAGAAGVSPMFGAGVAVVIPPNSAALLSSYVTFWSACELYKWKVNIIQLWSRTI